VSENTGPTVEQQRDAALQAYAQAAAENGVLRAKNRALRRQAKDLRAKLREAGK